MHFLLQDCYQHGTIWRNVFDKAEIRAQETAGKSVGKKKNLAVGDNGVSFTPVTDTWTARSLLMLCFVHVVSSLKLVIYHDCHIYVIWADCATHAICIIIYHGTASAIYDFLSIALF